MSAAALLVCALGIALSVYNIFKSGLHSFTDFLKYPFLILISIALAVIVVALLIKSQYIVDSIRADQEQVRLEGHHFRRAGQGHQ